jgi:hypothetical protein
VSCTTRGLPSGLIRTRVTVTNTTQTPVRAVVYGPALTNARFIQPRYHATYVYVHVGKERRSYVGFVIPAINTGTPGHVLFRLTKPARPRAILASLHSVVHADDWSSVLDSGCKVK